MREKTKECCVGQPESEKENAPETREEPNSEDLKKALAEEKAKSESHLIGWQRAQADFVNYKRFAEQEKAETSKFANANLILNLLPVIDDFERALAAIPPEGDAKKWVEGLKLIDSKFRDTLDKQGVTSIMALGMEFDPRFMDAVARGKGKRDMVVQELERGYMLLDKVIRPAKVIVGSGELEENKEEK
jgi:molecular chaperone GrpE